MSRGWRGVIAQFVGAGWLGAAVATSAVQDDPVGTPTPRRVQVMTEEGTSALLEIDAEDAWRGNPNSSVTVVNFGEVECGYCQRVEATLLPLYAAYADRVLFVDRWFPMSPDCNPGVVNLKHAHACDASRAEACAQAQHGYWAYHALALKNHHYLTLSALALYASTVGLEPDAFARCMSDPASLERVRVEASTGAAVGLHGVPRIFVGGTLYRSGVTTETLANAIELALGATARDAAAHAAAFRVPEYAAPPPLPADTPSVRTISLGELAFRIDTFEAALVQGRAVSGRHLVPAQRVDWYAARDACAAAGERLCTEREWVAACQGAAPVDDSGDGTYSDDVIEGHAYPYGDLHQPGRCWDARDPDTWRPLYTGELSGCVTEAGVVDLTGNVEEWVGDTPEHAALMGGAGDTTEDHARCHRRNDTFGPGYRTHRTGFRCCADVHVGATGG